MTRLPPAATACLVSTVMPCRPYFHLSYVSACHVRLFCCTQDLFYRSPKSYAKSCQQVSLQQLAQVSCRTAPLLPAQLQCRLTATPVCAAGSD